MTNPPFENLQLEIQVLKGERRTVACSPMIEKSIRNELAAHGLTDLIAVVVMSTLPRDHIIIVEPDRKNRRMLQKMGRKH